MVVIGIIGVVLKSVHGLQNLVIYAEIGSLSLENSCCFLLDLLVGGTQLRLKRGLIRFIGIGRLVVVIVIVIVVIG